MVADVLKILSRRKTWPAVVLLSASCLACGAGTYEEAQAQQDERPAASNANANAGPEVVRVRVPAEPEATSPSPEATAAPEETPTPEPPQPEAPALPAPEAEADEPARREDARRYLQMTEAEKREFVERRARHVSRMISSGTYEFSEEAITSIKYYVDAYARRVGNRSRATWGEDLNYVFARAQNYAPTIIRAFRGQHVPPAIGLYIVCIETEYTNFSNENFAGAAGLFQFIGSTAEAYGVPRGERTNVEKMSVAAARYIADRIAEFGTDPMSVALGIAGYNRSPDSVRGDLNTVMNSRNKERSFWTLVANSNKLDRWFQGENIKYVPKFFAAAIVGETPWAFGLDMKQPLSTWTEAPGEARRPKR